MPRGVANGTTILSEDTVRAIREIYLTGQVSFGELASDFGVSKATIQHVLSGSNWSWLLGDGEAEALARVRAERATR